MSELRVVQMNAEMAPFTELDGVIKIPTVFTRQGVQNKGFKSYEDQGPRIGLKGSVNTLEGRPVVYWHPPTPRPVEITKDIIIGHVSDVYADDEDQALKGITNIEVDKAPPIFIEALRRADDSVREGSVGYFSDADYTPGRYKGSTYERTEFNFNFDHYAVGIPLGACSVADGCGLGFDVERCPCTIMKAVDVNGVKMVKLEDVKIYVADKVMATFNATYERAQEDHEWTVNDEDPLAHHLIDGTLILRGVMAAAQVLQDQELEDEELEKAKKHLERHFHEFNKKAPWEIVDEMRMDEEGAQVVKDLTEEKVNLENKVRELEGQITEKDESLGEIQKLKDDLEDVTTKLKAYTDKDTAALEEQRVNLVKEILTLEEVEVNDENVKKYEGWTVKQLETLKAKFQPGSDRAAMAPPGGGGGGGRTDTEAASISVRGQKLTVGDMMIQPKKPGER